MEDSIKSISPQACPHCNNMIFIEATMSPATIVGVLSAADIQKAKEKAKEQLLEMSLPPSKNLAALAYLDDETTIFGENDIDLVLERFK